MTKLPDNETLLRFYREGLTDKQIAAAFGVSTQAVNLRFNKLGIERKPWSNTATAIIEAAWPSGEDFQRSRFTNSNRYRSLFSFMRWRLGDPTLTEKQLRAARQFLTYMRTEDVVLGLDLSQEIPWVWLPREAQDGRCILRWPPGREMPRGPHLEAISLPELSLV